MAKLKLSDSCRKAFCELEILTVPSIYIYELVCMVHRNLSNFTINRAKYQYRIRHKNVTLLPYKHSTSMYEKAGSYNGDKFFNALPKKLLYIKWVLLWCLTHKHPCCAFIYSFFVMLKIFPYICVYMFSGN